MNPDMRATVIAHLRSHADQHPESMGAYRDAFREAAYELQRLGEKIAELKSMAESIHVAGDMDAPIPIPITEIDVKVVGIAWTPSVTTLRGERVAGETTHVRAKSDTRPEYGGCNNEGSGDTRNEPMSRRDMIGEPDPPLAAGGSFERSDPPQESSCFWCGESPEPPKLVGIDRACKLAPGRFCGCVHSERIECDRSPEKL